ncbi:UbiA family prenyltransferase [Nonomuraea antimicrobica]|uniref:UbiA family prenyltransferase n=1 Tax=Nonomuraea antimicrobica TaxID=561173 RepID=A0ABP7AYL9_9ACTN
MVRAWLEVVRAPAAVSVPGDTMAGAAAAGLRWRPGLGVASTLLYWAGMALNDWADRADDAVERPERPIPSGRITPGQTLGLALGLTGAGLAAAAVSGGRRGLALAGLLAGAVYAYDLGLKRTPAGPAAMSLCRALDVLLGADGRPRALPMALAVGAHTYGISVLGRAEVEGATPATAHAALAATAAAAVLSLAACRDATVPGRLAAASALAGYLAVAVPAQAGLRVHAGPEQVRTAVRSSILALLPLQAAAVAGRGRLGQAGALLAAHPAGRWLSARMATS